MNICFYNVTASHRIGGLETYCWEAGHALAKRGHKVTIVAGEGGYRRYEDVGLVRFPFAERSRFPNLGTRFRKLMERLSFGHNAWRRLVEGNYDAILINKPFDFPAMWWAKQKGMRSQVAFRSGGTDFFPGDTFFASAVDRWISSSRYNASQVQERYGRNVTVIHNGVDTELFRPADGGAEAKERHGIPSGAPVLLSVGRLVGWKGFQVIVGLLVDLPSAHYIIIGEGPMRRELSGQAEQLGVAGRVHLLGAVAHHDLPPLFHQADIFVQPSIGEEAFGISVIEAMSCGIPVLASRNGGMVETVVDNETGLLLPPGDARAWLNAIAALLENPVRLAGMGGRARARVEEHFTWTANAAKHEQLLTMEKL